MAYNRFTIDAVRKAFGIRIVGDTSLFNGVDPVEPSDILVKFLERYLPLGSALGTEKARSEFILSLIHIWLQGTNVEAGREMLAQSGMNIMTADDLTDAAKMAVAAAA